MQELTQATDGYLAGTCGKVRSDSRIAPKVFFLPLKDPDCVDFVLAPSEIVVDPAHLRPCHCDE